MKFTCGLPDQYLTIEADTPEGAQEMAFARFVRDLKPQDFTVQETTEEWDADDAH